MVDRLLVDSDADGRVSVSLWPDGEYPRLVGPPLEVAWPLDADTLEDLRWYLEDYLRAPFGVYEERGPRVEANLPGWGQAVFGALFGAGPARDALTTLRARSGPVEIVFQSASPEFLGLPWELLRDPARPTPLALDGVAVSRSLPNASLTETFAVSGDRLRVLMVISRPAGADDVDYRMVARPLVERLDAVRGTVDLVVLRPPTMQRLAEVLAAAQAEGQPFQVVHFDGHGVLAGRGGGSGGPDRQRFGAPQGVLLFERADGGDDRVPVDRFAQVLAAAKVPVVVLNACQSGAVGKELETTVATRLLQGGAASVVAMAYSVYAVAAAEFMAAFYERLFAGDGVAAAVAAGRARLFQRPDRPSPKGPMPLADWTVPVHYARADVRFPGLRTDRAAGPSLELALDALRRSAAEAGDDDPLAPVGTFVGRDGLFYTLESAARHQRVVVVHGPGGTGKTELAKAFGRWWRDTGGVDQPSWVLWHSFEPGVASFGLAGVVDAIGLTVFGPAFARLEPPERVGVVRRLLAEHRLLLIWDNIETVYSMPDPTGATPPLNDAALAELKSFVDSMAGGESALLITSRSPEPWLGAVRRVEVPGLTTEDASAYADLLLAPYPATTAGRRKQRAFADLMRWLDGHPLSMRLVLPHLDTTDPDVLLAGLRGTVPLPGVDDGGRTTSLPASVAYSYTHLDPDTQRALAAVSLFHGVADARVVGILGRVDGAPERFRGLEAESWVTMLDRAAAVGLLGQLGAGMYRIHPALPAFLAARWRDEQPPAYQAERDGAERALLDAYSVFGAWLRQQIHTGDARFAFAVVEAQRRTLGALLGYALDHKLWTPAQAIAEPLSGYWDSRGLYEEARAWVDRVRLAVESTDGTAPPLDTAAGALWLFLVGSQANRDLVAHRLDHGEFTYRRILEALQHRPYSGQQRGLAVIYHQLGVVAERRGCLDEAEDWYLQSLEINDELGNRPDMASSYHQLGIVAEGRGRLDEAEDWYRQSLQIAEELGNRPGIARSYHELGIVAEGRGRLDEAEDWYRRSLQIKQDLGNRPGMASSLHHLGNVAQLRERPDEAENWYSQSLQIDEELGNRQGMARSYHRLGIVAEGRGRLDEAEDWYRRSLQIKQEQDNRPGMALTYGQLGLLAEQRDQPIQALTWMVRCISLFDEFPHHATGTGPTHLARLTALLGPDTLEQVWREVTGNPLPNAVRVYAQQQGSNT